VQEEGRGRPNSENMSAQIGARKRLRPCLESTSFSTEYGICWVIHFPIMWRYRVWLSVIEWSDEDSVAVSHRLFSLNHTVPFSVLFLFAFFLFLFLYSFKSLNGIAIGRTPPRNAHSFSLLLLVWFCLFEISLYFAPCWWTHKSTLASRPRHGVLRLIPSPSVSLCLLCCPFFVWWQV